MNQGTCQGWKVFVFNPALHHF